MRCENKITQKTSAYISKASRHIWIKLTTNRNKAYKKRLEHLYNVKEFAREIYYIIHLIQVIYVLKRRLGLGPLMIRRNI